MIKFERTEVYGMGAALRGMRNPLRSHSKADTVGDVPGEADLALARKLVQAGTDHRKFLRQIMVSVDIVAPRYWWVEFDTYKVGTVANSESTMHTITARPLTMGDFSWDLPGKKNDPMAEVIGQINGLLHMYNNYDTYRDDITAAKDEIWRAIIQLLPQSYNQMRTATLNYEVLLNQYHARKNHKLQEWHDYCDWVETLPYFKEICLEK